MTDSVRTYYIVLGCIIFALQLFGYIPIYLVWRKDCKIIGKNYLAVPLKERTLNYILICSIIWVGFLLNRHIWE